MAMANRLDKERTVTLNSDDELQYARKSYRYLRIALVSMVGAILAAVFLEWIDSGELLGSISAYYYTPVHAIFIGWLVLTGICMIAIRGRSDPEDIALNLAGLCAPIVAFVPTDFPAKETTYPNLIDDDLPLRDFAFNSVVAFLFAGLCSLALTFWLRKNRSGSSRGQALTDNSKIGFVLALATVAILIVVYAIWGLKETHGVAAIGLIAGLWFVATANGVRHLLDKDGKPTWRHHVDVGLAGSVFLFGGALAIAGFLRLIDGGSPIPCIVGAALVALVFILRRTSLRKFLFPPSNELKRYDRTYLRIASVMAIGAPAIAAWPAGFEHRTFWIELAELLPFGVFWIVQTIENWDEPLIVLPAPTPGTATSLPATGH